MELYQDKLDELNIMYQIKPENLTEEDVDHVCGLIKEFLNSS